MSNHSRASQNGIDQLPIALRPSEYSSWMQHGRPSNVPFKVDPNTFGPSLQAWWILLQPQSRGGDKLLRPSEIPKAEWKSLLKSHRNGFALIMVGMSWWGSALKAAKVGQADRFARWESVVEDIDWVLRKTLALYPAPPLVSSKRKIELAGTEKPPKRGRH